jgi:microcin C transport system ATP-binding protein
MARSSPHPEPLLTIDDLSVTFSTASGPIEAVRHASLTVSRSETVALVGESGSGKSVTALSILGLLPYPKARHPGGSIRFDHQELLGADEKTLMSVRGDRIAMIFQEPMTSLNPLHVVEKQIAETLKLRNNLDDQQAREKVLELLRLVHIPEPESRLTAYPHQLSGGQRQRVMIAMALANEPGLLIADEPTTAVDVTTQAQILDLITELRNNLAMGVLLITHDLDVVRKTADRVYVMRRGQIIEDGHTDSVLSHPKQAYTRQLVEAEPHRLTRSIPENSPVVLRGNQIQVWFPIKKGVLRKTVDHIKAADNVSLAIRAGETVGVVGESGSGKTSLALALLRLISSRGEIELLGHPLQALRQRRLKPLRRKMQVVFQDPYGSLSPRLSVNQIVAEGLVAHGIGTETERDARVIEALEGVGLDQTSRHRYPHEFSGGQRQRIALARAMIMQPDVLVLDEPTSALDRSVQVQMIDLLQRLQREHALAYLFISHDLRVIRALSDQIIVMRRGKVVEQGHADTIFSNPTHPYTRALMSAAFDLAVSDETALAQ